MSGSRRLAASTVAVLALVVGPGASHAAVYWGNLDSRTIGRAELDGTGVDQAFVPEASVATSNTMIDNTLYRTQPYGVAVGSGHIYWGEGSFCGCGSTSPMAGESVVGRSDLAGAAPDGSFIIGSNHPWGVAVDGSHVYWASYWAQYIGRANLDGTGVDDSFIHVNGRPTTLAVDGAHIYWAGDGPDGKELGRANLDGTGVNDAFLATSDVAQGVAVDASHIYWSNSGSGAIGRADLAGTNPNQTFIVGLQTPRGVAVDGTHIYWADSAANAIGRAKLDGTSVSQSFITGASAPYAVAIDPLTGTTTALAASPDHTTYGHALSFGATVSSDDNALNATTPTGHVDFTVTGEDPVSADLDGTGHAKFDPPYYLDVGDTVAAEYGGNSTYAPGITAIQPQIVAANTSMTLSSSANPQTVGGEVTITATVRNVDSEIVPFGTVEFMVDGQALSGPVDANGQAAITGTVEEAGDDTVTAVFFDDTGPLPDFRDSNVALIEHVVAAPSQPVPLAPAPAPAPAPPAVVDVRPSPPAACTVPRLKGMKLARAKRTLARAHCKLGKVVRKEGNRAQRGKVLSSRPKAGSRTRSAVKLVVSR